MVLSSWVFTIIFIDCGLIIFRVNNSSSSSYIHWNLGQNNPVTTDEFYKPVKYMGFSFLKGKMLLHLLFNTETDMLRLSFTDRVQENFSINPTCILHVDPLETFWL